MHKKALLHKVQHPIFCRAPPFNIQSIDANLLKALDFFAFTFFSTDLLYIGGTSYDNHIGNTANG